MRKSIWLMAAIAVVTLFCASMFILTQAENKGTVGFKITVNYANGDKTVINPRDFFSQFTALSISKDGNDVSSVTVELQMEASWEGTEQNTITSGTVTYSVDGVEKMISQIDDNDIFIGEVITIYAETLSTATIEGWSSSAGAKKLTLIGDVVLDVVYSDETSSMGAEAEATWKYTVDEAPSSPPLTQNNPPLAEANGPYTGTIGNAVAFSSSGSSDSDGTISTYKWTFGDGSSSTSANPSHTYNSEGTYSVKLKVTDDNGDIDTDTAQAFITAPSDPPPDVNTPPVALTNGPYSGPPGASISFSSGSYDSDGSIVSHYWTFGDGTSSTSTNPTHTYPVTASYMVYEVRLKVTDDDGATDTDTTTASISDSGLIDLSIIRSLSVTSKLAKLEPK